MTAFRTLLVALFVCICGYTLVVIAGHGLGLFQVYFGDIAAFGWPGQFNMDFLGFLILSGLWLAWRHHFSAGGIVLGMLGLFGGMPVLSTYLFIVSLRTRGNVAEMMLGPVRSRSIAS